MAAKRDLYYELGMLQVPWDQVDAAFKLVHDRANVQHCMGARGYAELWKGSESTGKRLCYDSGIDGTDGKYWIEDIPSVHVDWEMSEEEWEELRSTLAEQVEYHGKKKPYLWKLYQAGKIGKISPASTVTLAPAHVPELFGGPALGKPHLVASTGQPGQYRCSCGHRWTSLHKHLGPHPCPADPEHTPCR